METPPSIPDTDTPQSLSFLSSSINNRNFLPTYSFTTPIPPLLSVQPRTILFNHPLHTLLITTHNHSVSPRSLSIAVHSIATFMQRPSTCLHCPKVAFFARYYLHALSPVAASQWRPPSSSVRTRTVLSIVSRKRKRIVTTTRFSWPTPLSVAVAWSVSAELVMQI